MLRQVTTKGTLGCETHNEPFRCAEINLRAAGASRRFLLYCPVKNCGSGFRLTASDFMQVHIAPLEGEEDGEATAKGDSAEDNDREVGEV